MLVDLTMTLEEGMASHPIHGRNPVFTSGTMAHNRFYPGLGRRSPYDGSTVSYQNATILMCDHTGTHMDAPLHADPGGCGVDAFPVEYGFGEAVWLDLSSHFADEAEIRAEDLDAAEAVGGERIRTGDILLLWTAWSTVLPDVERYVHRHIGITREAAEWVRGRGVRTLGLDSPTPETVSGAPSAAVHMNFLRPAAIGPDEPAIAIVENLIRIDCIPQRRFRFCGLPLPLAGLTGSPVRALAAALDD